MLKALIINSVKIIMAGLAAGILLLSCREECVYKPVSLAGVEFRSVLDGRDAEAAVDSLTVRGLGREDSLLYDNRNNIRSLTLPINAMAEESGFIFEFDGETDTLWFTYRVNPWFLSQECGFVLNFELVDTRHTANIIDSVAIVTRVITSFDDTNIRIYH